VSVQRPDLSVDVALRAGRLTFERAYEREADYLAVKAMVAAGYDPAGLASYLERVQPPPGANRTLETLPARDQRVAAIQDAIRRLPARTYRADDEFAHAKAAIGPAK
jgi:predicted Zn-dependent protease